MESVTLDDTDSHARTRSCSSRQAANQTPRFCRSWSADAASAVDPQVGVAIQDAGAEAGHWSSAAAPECEASRLHQGGLDALYGRRGGREQQMRWALAACTCLCPCIVQSPPSGLVLGWFCLGCVFSIPALIIQILGPFLPLQPGNFTFGVLGQARSTPLFPVTTRVQFHILPPKNRLVSVSSHPNLTSPSVPTPPQTTTHLSSTKTRDTERKNKNKTGTFVFFFPIR